VQKLVLHEYLLHFTLGLVGLYLMTFKHTFPLKKVKKYTKITHTLILASNYIFIVLKKLRSSLSFKI